MRSRPIILIVESDQGVREAIALLLNQLGYEVVLAESGSGEEALALMTELDALDGLYTEIGLGGAVDGWAVGEEFRAIWPTKPIVYASGSRPEPPHRTGTGVFFRKPFDPEAFGDAFKAIRLAPGRHENSGPM